MLNTITKIEYVTASRQAAIFLSFLFLSFVSGLFTVSAGAYRMKQTRQKMQIPILTGNVIVIFVSNKGIPSSNVIEEIKQVDDLLACKPNAGYLIILKNINDKVNSFNIPSRNAKGNIISK